jgi:succinyl-CoA synthetase alpha subunit
MSILVDENTRVLVQGITGRQARIDVENMINYGTKVVAGVTPGKGGEYVYNVPVYNTVSSALSRHRVDCSVVYVPSFSVKDAVLEAIDHDIALIVIVSEKVPLHDTAEIIQHAKRKGIKIIGPNSLGVISPDKCKVGGIGGPLANKIFKRGNIGLISKSGSACVELGWTLKQNNLGITTAVSIGGEMLIGTRFKDLVPLFEMDHETDCIVIFGEVGTPYEEELADFLRIHRINKPIFAIIAGKFMDKLPSDITFGHGGAIISQGRGRVTDKVERLKEAGVKIVGSFTDLVTMLRARSA